MAANNTNRFSTYTSASGGSEGNNGEKENMWNTMLKSVASGKRLPEKNLLVMGMLSLYLAEVEEHRAD